MNLITCDRCGEPATAENPVERVTGATLEADLCAICRDAALAGALRTRRRSTHEPQRAS